MVNLGTHRTLSSPSKSLSHIIIVANNHESIETLQLDLNQEGYQASVINDGIRGLLAIQRVQADLQIIGWSPPRMAGTEICRRLRMSRCEAPIILLSETDSAEERIEGLEAGANDCISMPVQRKELLARIRAHLQRQDAITKKRDVLQCANIRLNISTRDVCIGDRFIKLTAKEFDLLECLMRNYCQVLSRSQILEQVWGYSYSGSSNVVEVYIRYLRRKLEPVQNKRLIHTIRSVGYILRDDQPSL